MRQRTRTRTRTTLAVLFTAATLGACSSEDVFEAGMERAVERAMESEGGEDVDIDLDFDAIADGEAGEFSIRVDGAEAQMGSNLDTPGWVPDGFPLPDDLNIAMAVVEDGQSNLAGSSQADADEVGEAITGWFAANGYEMLTDNTSPERFNFVAARGDDVIEGGMGYGSFSLTLSQRDVTFERQSAAEERNVPGVARIEVGELSFELAGECRIKGAEYNFDGSDTAADGSSSATANLSVYALQDPASGSGFASTMDVEANEFIQYSINFPMGNDDEPEVTVSEREFAVSGSFFDMLGGDPTQGRIAVSCDS